jgi:CheY-like chemotaxis protein
VLRRILVVEDEPGVARMLEIGLKRLVGGCEVTLVGHGLAALERLRAGERYDLVLCDVMMPVMDGIRFLRAVEEERLVGPRYLVLSAVGEERLGDVLLLPSVAGYVRKPVDLAALAEKVRGILGERQARLKTPMGAPERVRRTPVPAMPRKSSP